MKQIKLIPIGTVAPSVTSSSVSTLTGSTPSTWGWLPVLSLTSAIGVFLVALAANAGRVAVQWADPLFWFGLLVLFLPIAVRIVLPEPARRERIALLLLLGGTTYFFRFLDYPLNFSYTDEFLHWRGTNDIVASGHLFQINAGNPIASFYPGLEIVTDALSSLTGLSIFLAGSVVLIVGGLVLVLALYLLYECLSGSAQLAGIAMLLYMANPGWFSDTQFAYESLALPLAAFVLFVLIRRPYLPGAHRRSLTLSIWLGLAAVVITHHLTSYTLEAFLLLWTVVFLLLWTVTTFRRDGQRQNLVGPGGAAFLGLVLVVAWMAFTQWRVVSYLYAPLETTVQQILQILARKGSPRQLFHDGSGFVEPLWERVIGFASTALVALGLPFGLLQVWRQYRVNAAIVTLALGAIAYPISQLARLAPAGTVTVARAPVFLFVAVGFVLALGVMPWLSTPAKQSWKRSVTVTAVVALIFIGGWVTNTAPLWYRLPGPYLVSADHRSISPEGINAAEWAISYLGPNHRIASDRDNLSLMSTFGDQWAVTFQNDQVEVAQVFMSPQFGPAVWQILQKGRVQYLVVDRRLSTGLPRLGTYFNRAEPGANQHTMPIDPGALAKFDNVGNVSRLFDSGNIVIYDVRAISNPPKGISTPTKAACNTASSTAISPGNPHLAESYIGTIYDMPMGLTAELSLTNVQQRGVSVCGSFSRMPTDTLFNGVPSNTPFKGAITAPQQIQFVITSATGEATYSFAGGVEPDGVLTGTYCRPGEVKGTCSDYGLWSLSPLLKRP